MSHATPMTFLRLKEVARRTGYSQTRLYELMKLGRFPQSVPLGGRAVAWVEEEITDWMNERLVARSGK